MSRGLKLFIYDGRELGLMTVLGFLVLAFAFTLGLHYGKKVTLTHSSDHSELPEKASIHTEKTVLSEKDPLPNHQELEEVSKGAAAKAMEASSRMLRDEVVKSGLQLDPALPLDLPKDLPKPAPAHATPETAHAGAAHAPAEKAAEKKHAPFIFQVQVGSFVSEPEAKTFNDGLKVVGLNGLVEKSENSDHVLRYKVLLGHFLNLGDADEYGKKLTRQHLVDGYLIVKQKQDEQHDKTDH